MRTPQSAAPNPPAFRSPRHHALSGDAQLVVTGSLENHKSATVRHTDGG
ncbi:hypothetical protein HS125_03470 [bacterium]|nr:hypothetical protein [bacterium]